MAQYKIIKRKPLYWVMILNGINGEYIKLAGHFTKEQAENHIKLLSDGE